MYKKRKQQSLLEEDRRGNAFSPSIFKVSCFAQYIFRKRTFLSIIISIKAILNKID
jgi:hypothetical protein